MQAQFRARISYHNILLIITEMHLKFNTHPNLCKTNSGPSKTYSCLSLVILFLGTQEIWCLIPFIPITTGSTTVQQDPSTSLYFYSCPAPFSLSVCPELLAYVLAPHSLLCMAALSPLHFISAWASARSPAIPNSSYPKRNKHQ